jgi:hypothetical protein
MTSSISFEVAFGLRFGFGFAGVSGASASADESVSSLFWTGLD